MLFFILSSKSTLLNSFEKGPSSSQIKKANLQHLFDRYSFLPIEVYKRTCQEEEQSFFFFRGIFYIYSLKKIEDITVP